MGACCSGGAAGACKYMHRSRRCCCTGCWCAARNLDVCLQAWSCAEQDASVAAAGAATVVCWLLQEAAATWQPPAPAPDLYMNKYRHAWPAAITALRQYVETEQRRKRSGAAALPCPLPLAKFVWPQSLGKGGQRATMRCGGCYHCLRPTLKKACLAPIARDSEAGDGEVQRVSMGLYAGDPARRAVCL
jgi:hypothetical protein